MCVTACDTMGKIFANYLTKNRLGIYYFQVRIPTKIIAAVGNERKKRLFRKSLRTRDLATAVLIAKNIWAIMNVANKKYFSSPTLYGKASELLMRYEAIELLDYRAAIQFLEALDIDDSNLLDLALKQREYDSRATSEGSSNVKSSESSENPRLSDLINIWISFKKSKLIKSSFETLEARIRIFEKFMYECFGNDSVLIGQLTPQNIRDYREMLEKLPARRSNPTLKFKTLKELSEMKLEPISTKTYIYNLDIVKQFLNWARHDGYEVDIKLDGILVSTRKQTKAVPKSIRVPFSDIDIKSIFEHQRYSNSKLNFASDYWVPLISLFTGARLGEICQLLVTDIEKDDGVWCIKIKETDDEDKVLKAAGSERDVPIHNELIKLGLIDYRDAVSKRSEKLFPDEVRDESGRFSRIQKRFDHFIKKLNLPRKENETKSFHSFRHLVRTELSELAINEGHIDSIVGHTSRERSIGDKVYNHAKLIHIKNEAIQKLTYDIDYSKIKSWRLFKFARFI